MAATSGVAVELVGWRDRRGRFARLDDPARDAQRKGLQSLLRFAVKVAQQESPVGQGERRGPRFRDSWRFATQATGDGAAGELTNVAPHAGYVIFPTRPHLIRARRARTLRFEGASGPVFRRQVFHPGTDGNDVPGRTMRRLGPEMDATLRRSSGQVQTAIVDIFK